MAKLIYCIVRDYPQASNIVSELRTSGFAKDDISVLMQDTKSMRELAHDCEAKPVEARAAQGAATGAGAGGILGGAMGWLAGLGTLAIPGAGPLIVAGPLMAALSGVAVGAAFGGVTGALVGLGLSEAEAKRYAGKVKSGSVLISVHSENDEDIARAREIFERAGAGDISSAQESSVRDDTSAASEVADANEKSSAAERLSANERSRTDEPSRANDRSSTSKRSNAIDGSSADETSRAREERVERSANEQHARAASSEREPS
jgi:hypothetical protein